MSVWRVLLRSGIKSLAGIFNERVVTEPEWPLFPAKQRALLRQSRSLAWSAIVAKGERAPLSIRELDFLRALTALDAEYPTSTSAVKSVHDEACLTGCKLLVPHI